MKLTRAARAQLLKLIASAAPLNGTFFRSVAFRYFHPDDLISGDGTRQHGGRFVPVGVRAVYASAEEDTALREVLNEDPDRVEAAYQLCELHVRHLAEGKAADAVWEVLAGLPEPEMTVMKAAIALHRQDFATIRRLETPLSQVSPESSCFGMAVNCRCAWRAAANDSPHRVRLAREAIALADQAIAISPKAQTFLMRFNAVTMASDVDGVLETALHVGVKLMRQEQSVTDEFLLGHGAAVIIPKLERLKHTDVSQKRLSFVRTIFDEMMLSTGGVPSDVTRPSLEY